MKLEDIIVPFTEISITHITDKVVLSSAVSLKVFQLLEPINPLFFVLMAQDFL